MRLRPDGNKGMLVRSLTAFADYQASEAWTWEHQALVRARAGRRRPGAGRALRRGSAAISICRASATPRGCARSARHARAKHARAAWTRAGAGASTSSRGAAVLPTSSLWFNTRSCAGPPRYPDLAAGPTTSASLETLARLDLLPGAAAADLTEAYKALRGAYHRSALQDQPKTVADDQSARRSASGSGHCGGS